MPPYVGVQIHIWGLRSGIKRILHSAAEAFKIKHPWTDAVGSAGRMWPQRGWAGAGFPWRHQVLQPMPLAGRGSSLGECGGRGGGEALFP